MDAIEAEMTEGQTEATPLLMDILDLTLMGGNYNKSFSPWAP